MAHRPYDTLPAYRGVAPAPRPTPAYRGTPSWGLSDVPHVPSGDAVETPLQTEQVRVAKTFRMAGALLAGAAVTELVRYLVVVVNRSRPIPQWLDQFTGIAVLVFGVLAAAAAVVALWVFATWVREFRAAAYRRDGSVDPRHRWVTTALIVTPFVNVVGAPWLMLEATELDDSTKDARRRQVLRISSAWALVNAAAAIALGYRIAGLSSDSIQTAADGLLWTVLLTAAASAFLYWAVLRLPRVVDDEPVTHARARRMVAV